MGVFPVAIGGRQISPRRTGTQYPKHGVNETSIIFCYATPNALAPRQSRLKLRPRLIGYVMPTEIFAHGLPPDDRKAHYRSSRDDSI
jgi:hypothetical protein